MKIALLAIVVVTILMMGAPGAHAAGQASFNGASSAVQNAFTAVQAAGKDGGNITSLVAQLNGAVVLVQKASAENGSNPAQASTDLQSALGIAQRVQSLAGTVAQQGMSAKQAQFELSIGSAVVIVGIAIALYVYGDRIYRIVWLRVYSGHLVSKIG